MYMEMLFYIVLLILLFLFLFFELYKDFTYIRRVYSKEEACNFIRKDRDMYIELMSQYDIHARGCVTKEEYMEQACEAMTGINMIEYIMLAIACYMADTFFRDEMESNYIPDNHNIHKLPWIFIITSGKEYENGFPHTRSNIIILPDTMIYSKNLVSLLVHEKMHIYQRYNTNRIDELLKINGFTKYKTRDNYPMIRANPDLNNWVYRGRDGTPMYYEYSSKEPTSIEDVIRHGESEHPYEHIAYEVEHQYTNVGITFPRIR